MIAMMMVMMMMMMIRVTTSTAMVKSVTKLALTVIKSSNKEGICYITSVLHCIVPRNMLRHHPVYRRMFNLVKTMNDMATTIKSLLLGR